jgi:hypothetical protein
MPLTRRHLWAGGAVIVGAFTAFMVLRRLEGAHGLLLASGQPLFGDFVAFFTGGKLALLGQTGQLYSEDAARALQQTLMPGIALTAPFYSPPILLLLIAPLATLGYLPAALIFLALSLLAYGLAAWRLAPTKLALIFAATLPVAILHFGSLQTGLLVAGLFGLALYWLDKRPVWAGAAIAALAIKPHLAVLWPIMLIAQKRWRTFAAAAVVFVVLFVAAGALFGFETYGAFLANLKAAQGAVDNSRLGAQVYASLYANLLAMGAPSALAIGVHALSAAGALVLAVLIWRRGDANASAAALCAASLLISPYLFYYDTTLLGLGALMIGRTPTTRLEQYGLAFAWSAGLLAILLGPSLPYCPLAAWTLMAMAARRALPAQPRSNPR